MRDLKNCLLLVALCLIKLLNFICSKPQIWRHMFSFITGKVLGVFMDFFALHVLHFDKCNGVFVVVKFKT